MGRIVGGRKQGGPRPYEFRKVAGLVLNAHDLTKFVRSWEFLKIHPDATTRPNLPEDRGMKGYKGPTRKIKNGHVAGVEE